MLCKQLVKVEHGDCRLARYLVAENDVNLSSYLNEIAFKDTESIKIKPNEKEIESFNRYIERFKKVFL